MATGTTKSELLVLVGPTASGKSALALRIAKKLNGEIVAADSRTIFKGLDIGTAKPSQNDRSEVPHWGLDLIEPGQSFSAAEFKKYAEHKIKEIKSRGHLPILAGGTGLYIDSVLFNFSFGPKADQEKRRRLEELSLQELRSLITEKSLAMPRNGQNKRHLVRAIELDGREASSEESPNPNCLVVGLLPDDKTLKSKIEGRAREMFKSGVIEEAEELFRNYPDVDPGRVGLIYKLLFDVRAGSLNLEDALQAYEKLDWQYARRQRTWFRRNKFIQWFSSPTEAEHFILEALNT